MSNGVGIIFNLASHFVQKLKYTDAPLQMPKKLECVCAAQDEAAQKAAWKHAHTHTH